MRKFFTGFDKIISHPFLNCSHVKPFFINRMWNFHFSHVKKIILYPEKNYCMWFHPVFHMWKWFFSHVTHIEKITCEKTQFSTFRKIFSHVTHIENITCEKTQFFTFGKNFPNVNNTFFQLLVITTNHMWKYKYRIRFLKITSGKWLSNFQEIRDFK